MIPTASRCGTCCREDIHEINADLEKVITPGLGRVYTVKEVAEKYGIVYRALLKHNENHFLKNRKSVNLEAAERHHIVDAALEATKGSSDVTIGVLIDDLDLSRNALIDALNRAVRDGNAREIKDFSAAIRTTNVARAKLAGQDKDPTHVCAEPPPVAETPEFLELIGKILAPLFRFPDAYAEVVNVLEKEAGYMDATTTN